MLQHAKESVNDANSPPIIRRLLAPSREWVDWLFVPLVAQWLVVNVVLYYPYVQFLYSIGTFQRPFNVIFPFTWASALGVFVYGLWLFLRKYRLDLVRTTIYALGLPLAATSLFEIIWQNVGAGMHIGNQNPIGDLINLSSIVLLGCSFRYWTPARPTLYAVIAFLSGWLVWLSLGFPQITNTDPASARAAFVVNVILKVLAFALVGLVVSFAPKKSLAPPDPSMQLSTSGEELRRPSTNTP
jgi:hypothetical protein